jgi:hypothetical protein
MKKLFLALAAMATLGSAQAQKAGSILVYGDAGFTTQDMPGDNTSRNFGIHPGVGYYFNNNWAAGLRFGFNHNSRVQGNTPREGNNIWDAGLFVRYTQPISPIFDIFGQLEGGYRTSTARFDGEDVNGTRQVGYFVNFNPNVTINVTRCFGLNFGFGGLDYESVKPENGNSQSSNSVFRVTFGQQFNAGVQFTLGGKKGMRGYREPGHDTRGINTSDDDDMPRRNSSSSDDDE